MSDHSKISIVVPVYNEEKSIPVFLREMRKILSTITDDHEIIFALDPSSDGTEGVLLKECANDSRVKLLVFSRRFGQPAATWAGLGYASGEAIIIIDCDMQDPPNLIPEMVQCWRDEGYKVVIPQRRSRAGENFIKKAVAYAGYWFINKTASVTIPRNTGDFRLIDKSVMRVFNQMQEKGKYVRGLIAWSGFRQVPFYYEREARFAGETKYPFSKMLHLAITSMLYFSKKPLLISTALGFISVLLAAIYGFYAILGQIFGFTHADSGWTSIVALIVFFGGIQLLTIGIMGAYIGSLFDEIKNRPEYIVAETVNF